MTETACTLLAESAPGPLQGELRPPGDKSISHRALILATLAEGQSRIDGLLRAADVDATADACRRLGAHIEGGNGETRVQGVGRAGMAAPDGPLDLGNSGTAMRLLAGVLAAQGFDSVLTGDESLRRRPMDRIAQPLRKMGAVIRTAPGARAPLEIEGGHPLHGIVHRSPVASAQVKSCVLLAGLHAAGETRVIEPAPSRDHTERMLLAFGADMPGEIAVRGGGRLRATDLAVPADISSAAFLLAASVTVPRSRVLLRDVGLNPTRAGFIEALQAMNCDVVISRRRNFGAEPVADVEVRWRNGVRAIDLGTQSIPAIIDELPALMVVAALADGVTRIRGAAELRVKESDRIAVMAEALTRLGFAVSERPDGVDIEGDPLALERGGGAEVAVDAAGDHRCAMSFAVLAQALGNVVRISGAAGIATSYPDFTGDLSALGGAVRMEEEAAHA